jgi:protein TonB
LWNPAIPASSGQACYYHAWWIYSPPKPFVMDSKLPPKADFLDLLFENRNKAYGAYILRRDYPRNLRRGLLGSFLLVGFFALLIHRTLRESSGLPGITLPNRPPVELVDIIPPELDKKPAQPTTTTASVRPTIQDLVPIVVPDNEEVKHTVPTVEERMTADAGLRDAEGDPDAVSGLATEHMGVGPSVPLPAQPTPPAIYAFEAVESPAQFPGGDRALRRFLEQHLTVPEDAGEGLVRVMVRFVVKEDGGTEAFVVEQSGGKSYDEEVFRVLRKMPRWTPARQNQQNVAMYFLLPVLFQAH